ncbi:MAG: M20/M25/M40 family metallo-hydrolase [Deltaproteobacteria bacterium]|nr:M20/M25/M40 family metallo-hydrolase [Deltaproteobacteria bacterium]
MRKDALAFLQALLDAPSPSGYEGPARRLWVDAMEAVADEVRVDVHGNAIATINPGGSPKVMLAGHIDEIGFQICHIDPTGFLRFRPIGGHDMRAIAGRRISIHTARGPVFGVIGKRPIHLIADRNRSTPPPKAQSFWIDAGFSNRKHAEKFIQLGDPATYTEGFSPLRDKLVVARGLDNKVGAFVVAEVLAALAKGRQGKRPAKLAAEVSAVATVQEEIGLRGAQTSAFGLSPDVGIAVDVTWATDNPGGDAREIGEVALGQGPVVVRGANANPRLFDHLTQAAHAGRIPIQIRALPRAAGNDANAIQISGAGVAAGVVGIPQRYMHTPVEICHLGDVDRAIKLLVRTLRGMNARSSFIPE